LYDAVAAALEHLQLSHLQRKALIIISDGGDNASSYKYAEVLQRARRSQATIYSIVLVDNVSSEQRPSVLRKLTRDTGGAALFPDSPQAVIHSSALIAHDLREQYVLGYVPDKRAAKEGFHKIQVLVDSPQNRGLHVRTRAGYSSQNETAAIPRRRTDAP
jgi:Ca-activated chloride channel family protein